MRTCCSAWRSRRARLAPGRWTRKLAEVSYSVYLLHGVVGLTAMQIAGRYTQSQWVLLPGLAVVALAAGLSYRFVEKPSIALARRLTVPGGARTAPDALPGAVPAAVRAGD